MDVMKVFRAADAVVNRLPEPLGRGIFNVVGTVVGELPTTGTRQLRKNQARLRPDLRGAEARRLSRAAMRSYMRYYYEVFRLRSMNEADINAHFVAVNLEQMKTGMPQGRSFVGALLHAGNWDLAGAWATLNLGATATLVEKLEPEELYHSFVDFREGLGLTIFPVIKGGGAIHKLEGELAKGGVLVPLLADRDLTHTGIEVQLGEGIARVAPGPAILAQNLGLPLLPVLSYYQRVSRKRGVGTRWRVVVEAYDPVYSSVSPDASVAEKQRDLERMTQAWVSRMESGLRAHLEDWHMLQPLFVDDLDQDRLARSRERAAREREAEEARENA